MLADVSEETLQQINVDDYGVISLMRWSKNRPAGLGYRVKFTDIDTINFDELNNTAWIKAQPGSIQSMNFTKQDQTWDGDYGYAFGESDVVSLKVQHRQAARILSESLQNLLDQLTRPAKTFDELPEHWR